MVGWQPNYSNPRFKRMERAMRRRRRTAIRFFIQLFCIIIVIVSLYIAFARGDFSTLLIENNPKVTRETKTDSFNGTSKIEYVITENN